ncbi:hypothetical protein LJR034_006933 [Caballeronia sp. LjRoot34]|uniref:hypothetical protein n=1 Tax=Caballeronia sp. LjRoot34 TaxID=3342325 RepID=UPI003ECDBE60
MQIQSSPELKTAAHHQAPHRRHDRPVDAFYIWIYFAVVYCAVQYLTHHSVGFDDLRGLALGAAVVYFSAYLMDLIAKKLGPPFAPASAITKTKGEPG